MKIYGYLFAVNVQDGESGFVAYAPGVGGIYEEGQTEEEAINNAYEAACAILETRLERNDPITEENPYLKVLTAPPRKSYIDTITGVRDGYIATPRCLAPA
jgi:predicted RNase H-like HicB family nuclease